VRQRVERVAVVRAEPGKRRQVVRAHQDVHRVDLDDAERADERAQRPAVDARRPRPVELLRRDRERARLSGGDVHAVIVRAA
jgi:hypothetical protein